MYPIHITLAILFILLTWKYGDWRNWEKYYPTILFNITGSLIYDVLFIYNKPLWLLKSPVLLKHVLIELIIWIPILYSCTVIIYISNFPKKLHNKIHYIFMWIIVFTFIEFILYRYRAIEYFNNWSIWWSGVHYSYSFILLNLHYHKPLYAWPIAIVILVIIVFIFKLPISTLM